VRGCGSIARRFADMKGRMEFVVFEARRASTFIPTIEFLLMLLPCGSHGRRFCMLHAMVYWSRSKMDGSARFMYV
jgi:hypothetical protein